MDPNRTAETWTGTPGAIAPADGNAASAVAPADGNGTNPFDASIVGAQHAAPLLGTVDPGPNNDAPRCDRGEQRGTAISACPAFTWGEPPQTEKAVDNAKKAIDIASYKLYYVNYEIGQNPPFHSYSRIRV